MPAADPASSGRHHAPARQLAVAREARLGVSTAVYGVLRTLVRGINRCYWRVTVDFEGTIPETGPVLLAPVHRSFLDFFIVSQVTRRKIFYMGKAELWRHPRFGRFLEMLGAFPVHRDATDRLALDRAQAVLDRGDVLILFPEGTRRRGPQIEDLHEGAAFLAARTGAVVVPIGIGGSDVSMPPGSSVPRPTHVHLVVGAPLAPPSRTERGRVPRSQIRGFTEELEAALQHVFDRARAGVTTSRS